MQLPSFVFAADRDPLDRRTMEAVAIGVSDRNYRRSLESLPPWETDRSTSRSSVSRRFVQLSKKMLGEWMSRPLADFDVQGVMIDGLWIKDHCLLIALGIAAEGSKQVLGVREGSTERSAVVQGLLNDLRERGLRSERALVFVIDGSKALHKAVTVTFGPPAAIQRAGTYRLLRPIRRAPSTTPACTAYAQIFSLEQFHHEKRTAGCRIDARVEHFDQKTALSYRANYRVSRISAIRWSRVGPDPLWRSPPAHAHAHLIASQC